MSKLNCPACGKEVGLYKERETLTRDTIKNMPFNDNKGRSFHIDCARMILGCEPDRMIHDCGYVVIKDLPICNNCGKEVKL